MELNINMSIDDVSSLQDELLDRASLELINQLFDRGWDQNFDLYDKLEKKVVSVLENTIDADFKNSVAEKVTENLANKFERTKQYKSLIANGEVVSDSLIKTRLRDLVSDLVKK